MNRNPFCLILLSIFFLFSASPILLAQVDKILTLQEVYQLAITNSQQLKIANAAISISKSATDLEKTALTPKLDFSLSAAYLGNGVVMDRRFSNVHVVDMPHLGNNFSFEASQVIFAGGAITKGIEKAKLQEQVAQLNYDRNELDICFLLTGFYLDLYKLGNQREVFVKNIEQTELLITEIKSKEQQGMALSSDITRHELMLQNLKLGLIEIENNLDIINYQLLITLGLPPDTRIKPDVKILDIDLGIVNKDNLFELAMQNLPELKTVKLNKEIAAKDVRLAKSTYYPTIVAVASNHFDGPILIEVPTINSNYNYWYVGVGIQYNLSSIYKTNRKVQLAKAQELLTTYEEALTLERTQISVHSAYTKFMEAFDNLSVYETSSRLANENYRIINNRYVNDLVLITEMLDASNTKLNAELQVVNAKINLIYSYYKLQREIGLLKVSSNS